MRWYAACAQGFEVGDRHAAQAKSEEYDAPCTLNLLAHMKSHSDIDDVVSDIDNQDLQARLWEASSSGCAYAVPAIMKS